VGEGNFDYLTNTVKWDSEPRALPASLYLTEKPVFFGDLPCPWVDPTATTRARTLPARARFDSDAVIRERAPRGPAAAPRRR